MVVTTKEIVFQSGKKYQRADTIVDIWSNDWQDNKKLLKKGKKPFVNIIDEECEKCEEKKIFDRIIMTEKRNGIHKNIIHLKKGSRYWYAQEHREFWLYDIDLAKGCPVKTKNILSICVEWNSTRIIETCAI